MPFIEWTEEFSVGIPAIDRDHQKMIDMLNRLHDAVEAGHGREQLGPVLDELILYVSYHFGHEEGMLMHANYPQLEAHQREHQALTKQTQEIFSRFHAKPDESLSIETLAFLKSWLYNHILSADKRYSAYFAANNLTY